MEKDEDNTVINFKGGDKFWFNTTEEVFKDILEAENVSFYVIHLRDSKVAVKCSEILTIERFNS